MSNDVLAVIAAHNPATNLADLAASCAGAEVIVVDDASSTPVRVAGVSVIRVETNLGLGAALQLALETAHERGYRYLLTLDQDTVLPLGYVRRVRTAARQATSGGYRVGALGPRTFGDWSYSTSTDDFEETPEIIQSGLLLNVAALRAAGGFDPELFIDGVDTDACLRLRESGWQVVTIPLAIEHRIGEGRTVSVLGRRVMSTQHSAVRRYYIVRNRLILLHRYGWRHPRWALPTLRRLIVGVALSLTVEDHRRANARATVWGLRDAVTSRMGPLNAQRAMRLQG